MYDLEEANVKSFLKKHGAKRAAVQLPAGLREHLPDIMRAFDSAGVETIALADNCYGACDPGDIQAKLLGCDVLVHYGHSDMGIPTCLPTLYVEARMVVDPIKSVEQAISQMNFKRVGLLTTVQHVTHLKNVANLLTSNGLEPLIGEPGNRAKYPGQLLGCDFSCARSIASQVGGFLYIGTGDFHPLGAALATGKQVLAVNPVTEGSKLIAPATDAFLQRRKAMVARAAAGERFGVVASTKRGQARFNLARRLVENLKHSGRDAYLLAVDEVKPEELEDFKSDALVCTACPRIPIDDAERFRCPVLTPFETEVMLGKAKFETYRIDEITKVDINQE